MSYSYCVRPVIDFFDLIEVGRSMGIDRVARRDAPRSHVAELQLNPGRGVRYGLAAPRGR